MMQTIAKKQIGIIGLGKMGAALALNLKDHGWEVVVYNRTTAVAEELAQEAGLSVAHNFKELAEKLEAPRIVWLMLTAGEPVREAILGSGSGGAALKGILSEGDHLIDGGNSYYHDTQAISEALAGTGIKFTDVGVSGGPGGARNGASLMIGGAAEDFQYLESLFRDISVPEGYQFFAGPGAGHFVKMVHNGIEYGMMQAIAEGFTILHASDYHINVKDAARIYDHGTVITSRLIAWLSKAYEEHGADLPGVSGSVDQKGEGAWTVKAAAELGVPAEIIANSVDFRIRSQQNPSYTGKVLTALRNQFGGHELTGVKK